MDVKKTSSSFSRNPLARTADSPSLQISGVKYGANGVVFTSTGICDLDNILGGGFPLGTLVIVIEDPEAPHHLLLLRNFMSQGLVHNQPLLYASPFKNPRNFLGTLPSPIVSKGEMQQLPLENENQQEKMLRIAWQYKKYFGEQVVDNNRDNRGAYCNDFDLRKPLERKFLGARHVDCITLQDFPTFSSLRDHCTAFLAQHSRSEDGISVGRIVIQSLCAPHWEHSGMEWDMISFIRSLRSRLQSSNSVAILSLPSTVISDSLSKRCQHLADTVLSVRAIPDEDKELAKLLTGYQEMVGFVHVHKVAKINSQVPVILNGSTTFSLKLRKRRSLVLERLNQAPVDDASGGTSSTASGVCSSSKSSAFDF